MLTITDFSPNDLADLAARLTDDDRAELVAAGLTVECLEGVPAQALRWHGELVCLFGAVPQPSGAAVPWMMCTRTLRKVPKRQMAETARRVVNDWQAQYPKLINFVHRHHGSALRFLHWLGFSIDRTPNGPGGNFFIFTWERANV